MAGTEKGVTEPKATFSTCFGAPFLPLNPNVYARMLGEKIAKHGARVWLVNTGWTGGPYGVGSAHEDRLHARDDHRGADRAARQRQYRQHPDLQRRDAHEMPGRAGQRARSEKHMARRGGYDEQATKLAQMFIENFVTFEKDVAPSVKAAGPTAVSSHVQPKSRTRI